MIDELFTELFIQLNQLIKLFQSASGHISEYGVSHQMPDKEDMAIWNKVIANSINQRDCLVQLVDQGIEKNKVKIDSELTFFRQLSRKLDEINYRWTTYFDDIEDCLEKMAVLTDQIDEKYKMGWEKYS